MTTKILSAQFFANNAELLRKCADLRYLPGPTLDPTFGDGKWWTAGEPPGLTKHDLKLDGTDFRNLPEGNEAFGSITYDPPYVSVGGRDTTGILEMFEAYGLKGAPRTPALLQALIDEGLEEMYRLVKPGGYVLCKCMNYVSSGKLWLGQYRTIEQGLALGFIVQDIFIHVKKSGGPQPGNRTKKCPKCKGAIEGCEVCDEGRVPSLQEHSDQNASYLIVFKKKGRLR